MFAQFSLGYMKCPMFTDDRSCKCYVTRPKICRVDSFEIEGLDKDEYLVARCKLVHALKKIKDELGDTKSLRFILEEIAKSRIK